jgi:CheY-like chemotaxis protein
VLNSAPVPGRCILLVEDNIDLATAMAEILEIEGYTVTCSMNGAEGLAALRAGFHPAVIILDLMMPVMDGIEFRRHQQLDAAIASIPVVVVSGVGHMMDEIRATGVARCFRKPIDIDELLGVVTQLCRAA